MAAFSLWLYAHQGGNESWGFFFRKQAWWPMHISSLAIIHFLYNEVRPISMWEKQIIMHWKRKLTQCKHVFRSWHCKKLWEILSQSYLFRENGELTYSLYLIFWKITWQWSMRESYRKFPSQLLFRWNHTRQWMLAWHTISWIVCVAGAGVKCRARVGGARTRKETREERKSERAR